MKKIILASIATLALTTASFATDSVHKDKMAINLGYGTADVGDGGSSTIMIDYNFNALSFSDNYNDYKLNLKVGYGAIDNLTDLHFGVGVGYRILENFETEVFVNYTQLASNSATFGSGLVYGANATYYFHKSGKYIWNEWVPGSNFKDYGVGIDYRTGNMDYDIGSGSFDYSAVIGYLSIKFGN